MTERAYGPCDFCDGTGKDKRRDCQACEGTGRTEYVSEPIYKTRIVFLDGLEHELDLPAHCHAKTMITGRPDRMENVEVRFVRVDEAGVHHYRESLRVVR